MKRFLWLAALILMLVQPGCSFLVAAGREEAVPLSDVGEIRFGEPTTEDGCVVVPLKYAGGKWSKNSAIVPHSVDAALADGAIELTVSTSVATGKSRENGYRLVLPRGTQGTFTVYYRDPDGTRHAVGALKIAD